MGIHNNCWVARLLSITSISTINKYCLRSCPDVLSTPRHEESNRRCLEMQLHSTVRTQPVHIRSLCANKSGLGKRGEGRTFIDPWGYSNYLENCWPCAGGVSVVNCIGTQLRDPINSGPTGWWLAERGRKESSSRVITRFSLSAENEQDDAGRDDRTCPARSNSQGRTETKKNIFSLFS